MNHPCSMCLKPSDDWMVETGLISPSKSICGECKLSIGEQIVNSIRLDWRKHANLKKAHADIEEEGKRFVSRDEFADGHD